MQDVGNTGTLPSASHSLPVLVIAGTACLPPAHADPAAPTPCPNPSPPHARCCLGPSMEPVSRWRPPSGTEALQAALRPRPAPAAAPAAAALRPHLLPAARNCTMRPRPARPMRLPAAAGSPAASRCGRLCGFCRHCPGGPADPPPVRYQDTNPSPFFTDLTERNTPPPYAQGAARCWHI